MHLPDGFLNGGSALGFLAASVAVVGYAWTKVRQTLTEKVPVLQGILATGQGGLLTGSSSRVRPTQRALEMASVAGFIFAIQMVNFPILEGVSGHMMGAALAVALFGPMAAIVIMSVVVVLQALLYGDGGMMAMGANVFNIAIVGSVVAYGVGRLIISRWHWRGAKWIAVTLGAWASVVMASFFMGIQLMISGLGDLPMMIAILVIHSSIGMTEALLTVVLARFLIKSHTLNSHQ